MATTETNWIAEVGAPAFSSIAEMVAALNCNFDRLNELRDERTDWVDNVDGDADEQARTAADWSAAFPAESAELAELETAAGDCADMDDAQQRITEDPLSIRIFGERVDGEWEVSSAEILLTTGGPAVLLMVELDEDAEACRAWLKVQDWGKPWTDYCPGADSGEILLAYARQFCFSA